MEKLNEATALKNAIAQLEHQRWEEGKAVKEQLRTAYESLKPLNLIVSTLKDATVSIDLKNNLLSSAIGLFAGFLSKRLFESVSKSPFKRLLGSALMFGITNLIAKNPGMIISVGEKLINAIRPASTQKDNGVVQYQRGSRVPDLK